MRKIKYRPDIDGVRAIAILSVLIFHIDSTYLSGGFVGVDIFFVISGFLITGIIKQEIENTGSFSFKNFYIRRIRRLFPALIVVLLLTTIVATLILSPTHLASFGGSLVSSLLSISNIFFWVEADYFDVSSIYKPLLHTWSLSVEEQFYFIWPITLLFLLKLKQSWKIVSLMMFFVFISIYMNEKFDDGSVRFINNYLPYFKQYISDGSSTIFFLLPFRIYEFMVGALLVWIIQYKLKKIFFYDILFLLGLVFIGYSVLFFDDKMLFPSYVALLPTIGTGLLIYSGSISKFHILLSNKFMVWVGLISYSLYLVHWPIIVYTKYLFGHLNIYDNFFVVFISILLGYLSYRFIEQPFRTKRYDLSKFSLKYGSLFLVVLLAGGGCSMYSNNGWEWRINSPVNFENAGDSKNFHKKFYGGAGYPYTGAVYTKDPADIVLIGDSHARHYMEGIYKVLAKQNNLSLYNSSGLSCIMLPNFTRVKKGIDYDSLCPKELSTGIEFLKSGSKNSILVISESWLSQMRRADLLNENGDRKNVKVSIDDILTGIKKLKNLIGNKTLVVIGNVPGAGHNLYDVFTRPHIFFSKFNADDYIYTKVNQEKIIFNEKLLEVSKESGEFIFLDPHDVLCENEICRNLDSKKRLIYSDQGHLSKYGSIEVIKEFIPKFEKILNKKLVYEEE